MTNRSVVAKDVAAARRALARVNARPAIAASGAVSSEPEAHAREAVRIDRFVGRPIDGASVDLRMPSRAFA